MIGPTANLDHEGLFFMSVDKDFIEFLLEQGYEYELTYDEMVYEYCDWEKEVI